VRVLLFMGTERTETLYSHFLFLCSHRTYCGKIEKNEMGGTCGAYGGGERCVQGSGWEA
jgi:hypothetical protein